MSRTAGQAGSMAHDNKAHTGTARNHSAQASRLMRLVSWLRMQVLCVGHTGPHTGGHRSDDSSRPDRTPPLSGLTGPGFHTPLTTRA